MKNFTDSIRYIGLIGILYLISTSISFAQAGDHDGKFGLQLNGVSGLTDFKEYEDGKFGFLGRAFLRYGLNDYMQAELGGGYGMIKGVDFSDNYYQTLILPFDLRLMVHPFDSDGFNPYLFAGIGVLGYEVKDFPFDQIPEDEEAGNDWVGMVPLGVGHEFEIAEDVMLDLNATFAYSFTDDLNYYSRGANDAYASVGLGIVFVSNSGGTDDDRDGLIKSLEKVYGTDHKNPDTDGDGVNDGDEVNSYKTNPLKADTDGDGISDMDEINKYNTNPIKTDSDDDGISDIEEINEFNTDPNSSDSDNDKLSDSEEINKYKTDPNKADTDKDGLKDYAELNTYNTNPLKNDTDGDSLSDGEEVNKHNTNPLNIDSDGGTVSDRVEVQRGTNPNDAADDVVKVDVPMVLEGVTFATGKSDITTESAQILEKALKTLTTYNDIYVEIRGYTDNVGRKSSNIKLSQKRADSVRSWLIENGVDASRITAVGYGPENPMVPNTTSENKRKNRRIEFVRVK